VTGRPGPVWLDIPLDIQSAVEELHIPDVEIAGRDVVADAAMVAQYQDINAAFVA